MHNLATVLADQRHFAQAQLLLSSALGGRKRVLESEHSNTIDAQSEYPDTREKLACQLLEQSKSVEAQLLFEITLAMNERTEHPDISTV